MHVEMDGVLAEDDDFNCVDGMWLDADKTCPSSWQEGPYPVQKMWSKSLSHQEEKMCCMWLWRKISNEKTQLEQEELDEV